MMTIVGKQQGFTLLEVLVVLAIIGGLMSMATLTASSNPAEDETRQYARQLTVLLEAYREDAVFQNVDLGLAMTSQELLLLSYNNIHSDRVRNLDAKERAKIEKNPWQPHSEGTLKTSLEAPEDVEMVLYIEDEKIDFDELIDDKIGPKPALLFLSSDEYTPFRLELSHKSDNNFAVRLTGDGFSALFSEVERYEG